MKSYIILFCFLTSGCFAHVRGYHTPEEKLAHLEEKADHPARVSE